MDNTIGDVPLEWYREEEHVGYDADGRKIFKPGKGDSIEHLLQLVDDPSYWRTVFDEKGGNEPKLSKAQVELIQKLRGGVMPRHFFGVEQEIQDVAGQELDKAPGQAREPKRRFIPSKWEAKMVIRIIRSLRNGYLHKPVTNNVSQGLRLIWDSLRTPTGNINVPQSLVIPKTRAPSHIDSYNPPVEYRTTDVFSGSSRNKQTSQVYQNVYGALRKVPSYAPYVIDRFRRCLDLYLCPRVEKHRISVHPSDILPPLPNPKELRPFPTTEMLRMTGHRGKVLSIAPDPTGNWLVSGSSDRTMRKWEISTGRCIRVWHFTKEVKHVAWCPRLGNIISACVGAAVVLIDSADDSGQYSTGQHEAQIPNMEITEHTTPKWAERSGMIFVLHSADVTKVIWHHKGDYFASMVSDGKHVMINRLSRKSSQQIFRHQKIPIRSIAFHPHGPVLFICTGSHVHLYDLQRQILLKKLSTGTRALSCMAIHSGGENIIVGGEDGKVSWFDLDLSTMPYKVLGSHASAVKDVDFHPTYPLFASASDDATLHVFHGMVHADLDRNALITPLRILRSHCSQDCEGVKGCAFHPTQPWLFSAGADGSIILFCDDV